MKQTFEAEVMQRIEEGESLSRVRLENLAKEYGIQDKTEVKELVELAIVETARKIIKTAPSPRIAFQSILKLYEKQANLSHRTSKSTMLQQYSTPAPIAYLAGLFCGLHNPDGLHGKSPRFFEPSAGNGMLTIGGRAQNFVVNEVDEVRRANLRKRGYIAVGKQDASQAFPRAHRKAYHAVLTNPPFGRLDPPEMRGGVKISALDHLMTIQALNCMKDDGRAAIIIGGHTEWDHLGRVQRGKNRIFISYLYRHYHVVDVLQIKGALYSRMGTRFPIRLILIAGRKNVAEGVAPLKKENDVVLNTFNQIWDRVNQATQTANQLTMPDNLDYFEMEAERLLSQLEALDTSSLDGPYRPTSKSCISLETMVPDSMDYEIHSALERVQKEVGTPLIELVQDRLGYASQDDLCASLAAEQIDAVALAIFNIEWRGQGLIVGDQTGIGKGRVAAAMIRYGVNMGVKPIFLSEKANLFSDLYRDLKAIGAGALRPLIINTRNAKSHVKNQNGVVVYKAPVQAEALAIFDSGTVPDDFDFVMATYTQFSSEKGNGQLKRDFLMSIAEDNLMVLDESHNASGSSQTGEYLQKVTSLSAGIVFLSATYAKRPDNMPIYASKTAISEANMDAETLAWAVKTGGVALQEVISSQLVEEGQLIRRERSFEGVEVNYITLDKTASKFGLEDLSNQHKLDADAITDVMREIIEFQREVVAPAIAEADERLAKEAKEIRKRGGTSRAGLDNHPYFSKVFNAINQMLMAIKAEQVAKLAIRRLKEGKKPVIAFASTMESYFNTLDNLHGEPAEIGDLVRADFASVLQKGLDGVLRITIEDHAGNKTYNIIPVSSLPFEGQEMYYQISERIQSISTRITISPIDHVKQLIEQAGFSVAEVTGRSRSLELDLDSMEPSEVITPSGEIITEGMITGVLRSRKRINVNDAFRQFNDNEVDVLMINQSGSTGASAHAIPTEKVPASEVKQRVMIVLQAELDINTEVQKRGRINRTGQIQKPIYDYVVSAIPAETRLMMMLQQKLKSLDANTASNQNNSEALLSSDDFLNKYGDVVVKEFLTEHPAIGNVLLDEYEDSGSWGTKQALSTFVTGRVAVLSTKEQEHFYTSVIRAYKAYITELIEEDKYDLEMQLKDYEAKPINSWVRIVGRDGHSHFGKDTILTEYDVKNLKKPLTQSEIETKLGETLKGVDPIVYQKALLKEFEASIESRRAKNLAQVNARFDRQENQVPRKKEVTSIEDEKLRDQKMDELLKEIEEERKATVTSTMQKYALQETIYGEFFRELYPGRGVNLIEKGKENEPVGLTPAIFLGFSFNPSGANKFAPSGIVIRFAVASSKRMLTLSPTAKNLERLQSIVRNGNEYKELHASKQLLEEWSEITKRQRNDRTRRFIVTGNLLQGAGRYNGRLISFTTHEGKVEKGLLMPEHYDYKDREETKVNVPAGAGEKFVRALADGKFLMTSGEVTFMGKNGNSIKVMVPGSKKSGGKYYQSQKLIDLVDGQFEMISGQMVATIPKENIGPFLNYLDDQFRESLLVSPGQFSSLSEDEIRPKRKPLFRLVPTQPDDLAQWEIEAEAALLLLELEDFKITA